MGISVETELSFNMTANLFACNDEIQSQADKNVTWL